MTTAWAYIPPTAPASITASRVVTSGEGGIVSLMIDGLDGANTGSLQITSAAGETLEVRVRPNDDSAQIPRYRVGSNTLTMVTVDTDLAVRPAPRSRRIHLRGRARPSSTNGIGAPTGLSLTLSATSGGRRHLDASRREATR